MVEESREAKTPLVPGNSSQVGQVTSDEAEADKGAERIRVTENSFDTRRKWKQKPALHFLCYILLTSLDQITKNRLKRQPFSPFSH